MLACSSAKDKPTVADDTGVFQLLVYHADSTNHIAEQYIMYMGTSREIIPIQILKITWTIPLYDPCSSCMRLVVVTTSRPYGIGKVTVLSKYAALSRAADVFLSAKADIVKLGEKVLLVIRG